MKKKKKNLSNDYGAYYSCNVQVDRRYAQIEWWSAIKGLGGDWFVNLATCASPPFKKKRGGLSCTYYHNPWHANERQGWPPPPFLGWFTQRPLNCKSSTADSGKSRPHIIIPGAASFILISTFLYYYYFVPTLFLFVRDSVHVHQGCHQGVVDGVAFFRSTISLASLLISF